MAHGRFDTFTFRLHFVDHTWPLRLFEYWKQY
jgi:hypothetical protein